MFFRLLWPPQSNCRLASGSFLKGSLRPRLRQSKKPDLRAALERSRLEEAGLCSLLLVLSCAL